MELLELNTKDEQSNFFNLTAKSTDLSNSNYFHIGAQVFNGFWRWIVSRNLLDYEMDWYPGEPNNSGVSRNTETCLSIHKDRKNVVGFNDIRCDRSKCFYLCQILQKKEVTTKTTMALETSESPLNILNQDTTSTYVEYSTITTESTQKLESTSQKFTNINLNPTLTSIEMSSEFTPDFNSTENEIFLEIIENPTSIITKNTTTTYNSTISNSQIVSFTNINSTTINGSTLTQQFSNISNTSHQSKNVTVIRETLIKKTP